MFVFPARWNVYSEGMVEVSCVTQSIPKSLFTNSLVTGIRSFCKVGVFKQQIN